MPPGSTPNVLIPNLLFLTSILLTLTMFSEHSYFHFYSLNITCGCGNKSSFKKIKEKTENVVICSYIFLKNLQSGLYVKLEKCAYNSYNTASSNGKSSVERYSIKNSEQINVYQHTVALHGI